MKYTSINKKVIIRLEYIKYNSTKAAMLFMVFMAITLTTNAQFSIGGPGTSGSGTFGNGTNDTAPTVPFDGGMSLLLALSGVGFASKKLKIKNLDL